MDKGNTEELRRAFRCYRALFDELVGPVDATVSGDAPYAGRASAGATAAVPAPQPGRRPIHQTSTLDRSRLATDLASNSPKERRPAGAPGSGQNLDRSAAVRRLRVMSDRGLVRSTGFGTCSIEEPFYPASRRITPRSAAPCVARAASGSSANRPNDARMVIPSM
jgi:hypothetical protein